MFCRIEVAFRDVFAGVQPDPNYGKDMCLRMLRKPTRSYSNPARPQH